MVGESSAADVQQPGTTTWSETSPLAMFLIWPKETLWTALLANWLALSAHLGPVQSTLPAVIPMPSLSESLWKGSIHQSRPADA